MIHDRRLLTTIKMSFVAIIAIFLLFTSAHAQSVKSLQGSAFDVALTEPDDNFIKIPITVTADSGTITLSLVNVTFDNPARTIPNSAFEARIETDDLHNAFLKIIIHNRHPLDQGKYHLLFNLVKTKPVAHPETFILDLTVKPATLSPVTNQVASRIQNIPFGPFTQAYKPLTIFETSRNAIVFPVTIRQLALNDTKGAEVSTADITFKDTDLAVMAGRQAHFPYQVQGDLPIGTVSGSFEISAPQLAAPVVFKLDIITKRSGWWIIFLILTGLLFGYGTRIALDEILKVNRARKELIEFSQQLDEEKINKPDDIFCMAVDVMLQKLDGAKKKNVSDINAAIAGVRTDLAAAYTDLSTRQVTLQTKLKAFF